MRINKQYTSKYNIYFKKLKVYRQMRVIGLHSYRAVWVNWTTFLQSSMGELDYIPTEQYG